VPSALPLLQHPQRVCLSFFPPPPANQSTNALHSSVLLL
jgi:hypothetical protein